MRITKLLTLVLAVTTISGCRWSLGVDQPVRDIGREEFESIFKPDKFRTASLHHYHGDRDGFAFVSWEEWEGAKRYAKVVARHRFRVPLADVGLPRSFPFTGWDNRTYFDIFGDIAHLDAAREQFEAGEEPSPVTGVSKWRYQPVRIPDAPPGTWAFWSPASNGKHGHLYAPGFRRDQYRGATDKYGLRFNAYPHSIAGLGAIEVHETHAHSKIAEHYAPWLKNWYSFTERP